MCGVEILLCCAAGGAAGCCAKNKLDKRGKQGSGKIVKGDGEVRRRNSNESRRHEDKKSSDKKKKSAEQPKQRLPAYEEYQARYNAKPATNAHNSQESSLTHRSAQPALSKGGQMDLDEFSRLKQAQRRENLNKLR